MHRYGEIVNVDRALTPYGNTRRLVTDADVKNDDRRAHSSVVPGNAAVKDASGKFIQAAVWEYLFTHPVEVTGDSVLPDPNCPKDQRKTIQNPDKAKGKPPSVCGLVWLNASRVSRRWLRNPAPMFRFTIRDVLWLTVVVAMGVALWMDHYRNSEAGQLRWRNYVLEFALKKEGWKVEQWGRQCYSEEGALACMAGISRFERPS